MRVSIKQEYVAHGTGREKAVLESGSLAHDNVQLVIRKRTKNHSMGVLGQFYAVTIPWTEIDFPQVAQSMAALTCPTGAFPLVRLRLVHNSH